MSASASLSKSANATAPRLGYGLWQVPAESASPLVRRALNVGYRWIDTAEAYYNEEGVGDGIRDSGVARDDITLATKVWNTHHGYDRTLQAFEASLQRLGVDYVDLYLMHWPSRMRNAYVQTWEAMLRLRREGRARAIGVCNFSIPQLRRLISETGEAPVLNQVELHPYFQQKALREFHAVQGIKTQSWSPLGLLGTGPSPLHAPLIQELSVKYRKTPAQIVLRWHLDNELLVITKSIQTPRIEENFDIFDFTLDPDDCLRIGALDRPGGRLGPNPETADF